MKEAHRIFLASPEWGAMLREQLLPWLESLGDLGDDLLEIGPGPGLTTDLLRTLATQVTAVELDADLAGALAARLEGSNVEVVRGDATDTGLADDRFSAATSLTMLHHVPTAEAQDAIFTEMHRVLRPGGLFVGMDSLASEPLRQFHEDDVYVPLDPADMPERLGRAGFTDISVEVGEHEFHFHARKSLEAMAQLKRT